MAKKLPYTPPSSRSLDDLPTPGMPGYTYMNNPKSFWQRTKDNFNRKPTWEKIFYPVMLLLTLAAGALVLDKKLSSRPYQFVLEKKIFVTQDQTWYFGYYVEAPEHQAIEMWDPSFFDDHMVGDTLEINMTEAQFEKITTYPTRTWK